MIYSFTENLTLNAPGPKYQDITKEFAERGKCVIGFVVLDSGQLAPKSQVLIDSLTPHLIESRRTLQWPGTRQLVGPGVDMLCYDLNSETSDMICSLTDDLFQWLEPDLPEDLFIIDSEGHEVLVTVAHEREGFLELEPTDTLVRRLLSDGRIDARPVFDLPD